MKYLPALTYGFGGSYFLLTQNDYLALIAFQGITVALLASMASSENWGIALWTIILGASLVARLITLAITKMSPINKAAKYRRWDALAAMIGYSVTTGYLLKALIPGKKAIRKYLGLVTCGIPSVVAMGIALFAKHEDDLSEYATFSGAVYEKYTYRDASTDTRVAVSSENDTIVISFAGTDSAQNVLTDLRVTDSAFPVCGNQKTRVHAGFLKAWNSVREYVFETIRGKSKVTLTGHSLGGALAMLAGLDIACSMSDVDVSVITFGAPAVGDELFVDTFSQKISRSVRVVNPLDPVPRGLTSQFTHVQGLYFVPATKLNPHDISSYEKAVGYSMGWKVVSMILPIVYVTVIVLVFLKLKVSTAGA